MGFWASKTLLSAVELGLFTGSPTGPKTGAELEQALGLHPRATYDFLDALVALGLLARRGDGAEGRYMNTPATALYLDRASPRYVGGMLEMANSRLYPFWADLTAGAPDRQAAERDQAPGKPMFDELYADPARLEQFMAAMAGVSRANFEAFADKFDFSPYRSLADIGGATGQLAAIVAGAPSAPRLRSLRPAGGHARSPSAASPRPASRTASAPGRSTSSSDEFPSADLITMGMILHDWNLEHKKMLIAKAYRALPEGGAFVAIENIIDDARRDNAFGLMMSLNMLIEFGDAFDFTGADFTAWCLEAGFSRCEILPLGGPASAAIAYK